MPKKATAAPASLGSKFDRVVRTLIEARDKRAAIKDKYAKLIEEEDAPLAQMEEKLRTWLQQQLLDAGVDNMSTSAGTVYFTTTQKVNVVDWPAFRDYIQKTGEIELLERRASKNNVVEHIKTNHGELPAGVTLETNRNLNVRRK